MNLRLWALAQAAFAAVVVWFAAGFTPWSVEGGGSPRGADFWGEWADDPIPCDHHVHVLSPRLMAHWKALGMPFSRPDEAYSDPRSILRREGIGRAVLVSMAHLYASDDFGELPEIGVREAEWVAAENDFVGECVAAAPERLVGFFSVNPFRPYADSEIERCRAIPGLVGLKLHLPACGCDWNDRSHVAMLRGLFARCAEQRLPLLVHVAALDGEFGERQAAVFWRELVEPHPALRLTLAHLGAAGGYSARSAAMLEGYQRWMAPLRGAEEREIFFDLSGAILDAETDGAPRTEDEACRRLAEQMRAIGLRRFLFASDYPVFEPQAVRDSLRARLPLAAAEIDQLLTQEAPLFDVLRRRESGE